VGRTFDLNIETILEHWQVEHALRELIANALDETQLSGCQGIEVKKDELGRWVVRDYGRGLQIDHFTLNESVEKLSRKAGVIGKFGFGLKDAVATLHRRGIVFQAESRYGRFTVEDADKSGFEAIRTLHVNYEERLTNFRGTCYVFGNLTDEAVELAKAFFLKFSKLQRLEITKWRGYILERGPRGGEIFINGVKVNEEPNFMFSYSIEKLTAAMRKELNRERSNVGRSVYVARIKTMLQDAEEEAVLSRLAEEADGNGQESKFDEMHWIEVRQKALLELSKRKPAVFITQAEEHENRALSDHARADGQLVRIVTEQEKDRLNELADHNPSIRLLNHYAKSFNDSFQYKFVEPHELTQAERNILAQVNVLAATIGLDAKKIPCIRISESMRQQQDVTVGAWDHAIGAIVIKRSQLTSLEAFAGTLLHEIAHALTGCPDVSREFESVLTDYLGKAALAAIKADGGPTNKAKMAPG
jgi:hypothetical protein